MAIQMTANAMDNGQPLFIYGAGGHGLVVAEAAEASGAWQVKGFLDEQPIATSIGPWPFYQAVPAGAYGHGVIIAVGDNMARRRLAADIVTSGLQLVNVIHPTAWVSPSVILGRGIYIGAHAVVNSQATVEDGVIINSGAVIEHHCIVGAYTHVGPCAALCGNVKIGSLTTIGAGAVVKPEITIGDDCTIGAGAAVVRDITASQIVAGVPAKPINRPTSADVRLAQ